MKYSYMWRSSGPASARSVGLSDFSQLRGPWRNNSEMDSWKILVSSRPVTRACHTPWLAAKISFLISDTERTTGSVRFARIPTLASNLTKRIPSEARDRAKKDRWGSGQVSKLNGMMTRIICEQLWRHANRLSCLLQFNDRMDFQKIQ